MPIALGYAGDSRQELRFLTRRGRHLGDRIVRDPGDVSNRVDDEPDGLIRQVHDDDALRWAALEGRKTKALSKVDDGQDDAAEIDQALDPGRRFRHTNDGEDRDNFLDLPNLDAIGFGREVESNYL